MTVNDLTTYVDVDLSWAEVRAAAYLGIDRFIRARANGRTPVNGQPPNDVAADILGAWGECVIARLTDCYWSANTITPDRGAPDVGPWHVRTRARADYELILHDTDTDDEPFVLVVVLTLPRFRVVGWCNPRDVKTPEHWQTFTGRPAYFVPHSALRPIDEWRES